MDFNKLYVDNLFLRSLEKICIQEHWMHDIGEITINRNSLKKRVLLYLTLFEEIDSPSLFFYEKDCDKLIDAGFFSTNSDLFDISQSNFEKELSLKGSSKHRKMIESVRKLADHLIESNPFKIIDQNYFKVSSKNANSDEEYNLDDSIPLSTLINDFKYLLDVNESVVSYKRPDLIEFKDTIENSRNSLEELFFLSETEQIPFFTNYSFKNSSVKDKKVKYTEEALYVVKTKLQDEIIYLPNPSNLKDVIKMRSHPSINRFRSILSEWSYYIREGEAKLESKARKDIKKANREIRSLEKWQEFKTSPFNFWTNSIGGHIPILSNILTVVFMIDGLYEKHVENKSKWIMIGK